MTTSIGRNSGSTATPTKATFSYWIKGKADGTNQGIWGWHRGNDASNYWLGVYHATNDSMYFNWKQAGSYGGIRGTMQKFRDPNAWGHHVIAIDSTISTEADRIKWYYNGERITVFEDSSYTIAQNATISNWSNSQDKIEIGTFYQNSNGLNLKNHCISHFHFTDGYAYDASAFGETDATTGEWKIKTSPSVTYGNEGFFMFKNDAALTDKSGNGNNFTLDQGTLTKTEDSPSNVFATWNPLNQTSNMNFTNGNTKLSSSVAWLGQVSTLAMPSGKYYWEIKYGSGNIGYGVGTWGMASTNTADLSNSNYGYVGKYPGGYELFQNSGQPYKLNNSNNDGNYGSEASAGEIIMVAFDADNNKLFTGINGTWNNSSDPANGTSPMYTVTSGKLYVPSCSIENGSLETNFGNGYFGTTAVSSAGTNASGNGIFEYDVPTGYTALSTKGLNL